MSMASTGRRARFSLPLIQAMDGEEEEDDEADEEEEEGQQQQDENSFDEEDEEEEEEEEQEPVRVRQVATDLRVCAIGTYT
jgi:hypothetical protein